MNDDSVLQLSQPGTFSDPLTEVLRSGARSLLAHAVEAELAGKIARVDRIPFQSNDVPRLQLPLTLREISLIVDVLQSLLKRQPMRGALLNRVKP